MDIVLMNGKLVKANKVVIPLQSNWAKFAPGFFETMKAYEYSILHWDLHYERLVWAAKFWQIKLPGKKKLHKDLLQLLRKNNASSGRLRMQFNIHLEEHTYDVLATHTRLDEVHYELNRSGWNIGLYEHQRILNSDTTHFKSNQRDVYLLSKKWAFENGLDQAIVMNESNQIIDTTNCNLFWVKNGQVFTPLLKSGGVDGCFRRFLLKEEKHFGVKVKMKVCKPNSLLKADEIFLTNVIRGFRWVSEFDGKTYTNEVCTQLFEQLKIWESRI